MARGILGGEGCHESSVADGTKESICRPAFISHRRHVFLAIFVFIVIFGSQKRNQTRYPILRKKNRSPQFEFLLFQCILCSLRHRTLRRKMISKRDTKHRHNDTDCEAVHDDDKGSEDPNDDTIARHETSEPYTFSFQKRPQHI